MDTPPLICAEKRQTPYEYEHKEDNGWYTWKYTSKKLPLPKWKVDENGKVPVGKKEQFLRQKRLAIVLLGIETKKIYLIYPF